MKKALHIVLALTVFVILGNISSAWSTNISHEPKNLQGPRQARITNASNNFISVIGYHAKITSIRGNQITLQNLADSSKTATVNVDNASLFKAGQQVNVSARLLTPR